ncbi:MAG: S8 family peptidase [Halioglobus sp.]
MPISKYIPLLPIVLVLAGCGGGGGGGSGSSGDGSEAVTPEPEPVELPESFTVSGSINIANNLAVDSDNNNPEALNEANNQFFSAQAISNPVTLGGYVSVVGAGEPGALTAEGDEDDYFRLDMLEGQSVTLLVAEFQQADADLYLYDEAGRIIDFSILGGRVETLTIPRDGTYTVNVFAYSGATNYVLAIGNSTLVPALTAPMHSEIIPWQVVVRQHRGASNRRTVGRGMRIKSGRQERGQLMAFTGNSLATIESHRRMAGTRVHEHLAHDPELLARWQTLITVKALQGEDDIVLAEPNYRVRAMATPDDPAYASQWHYPLINLPSAWDITTGSPDVTVAVIDTGILSGHSDLQGQIVAGYDFIADPRSAADGDGIDPDPQDPGDGGNLGNSSFHGTHVAGTIAASSNNGRGVAGVAWNVGLMPLRVLGVDGGNTYDVEQAIRYAAGLENDSGTVPAKTADVINLSLGGSSYISSTQTLLNEVHARGITVVAAAGNEASNAAVYPAAYDGVISVSAVDAQRKATSYSNYGSQIDVAAPGGDNGVDITGDGYPDGILSTGASVSASGLDYVYSFLNGTSMASPHIAGVVGLMKSVNPNLRPADIDSLLQQGVLTDDLGATGRDDRYGHGLINAQAAVVAALNAAGASPADDPRLSTTSPTLNFGSHIDQLELVLQNSGKGELVLLSVGTSQPWLQISSLDTSQQGLGRYQVSVDRSELPQGIYRGEINAISSVNTLTTEVLLSVEDDSSSGDIGLVYLLLIDTSSGEPVDQYVVSSNRGRFEFEFRDVPPGNYQILAGTDADNDLFICDPGEACGAYLTIDQPIEIDLDTDLGDLQFSVDYQVNIPAISSLNDAVPTIRRKGKSRNL